MTRCGVAVLGVVLVLGASGTAVADDPDYAHWKEHPHHISLVIGGTDTEEHTAFTLGLDYEYRVSQLLGLGTVVEYAFEDIDAFTVLAVADIHLWEGWAIQTGPGLELIDDDDFFVYRIGTLYEFVLGDYTVSPQVHLDVTDEERAVIFGVAVGFPF